MGLAAGEAGPINDVRFALENGLDQFWIFRRVVFEVGVLNNHEIAGRGPNTRAQRCAFPAVPVVKENPVNKSTWGDVALELIGCSVGGAIIDDDDLLIRIG